MFACSLVWFRWSCFRKEWWRQAKSVHFWNLSTNSKNATEDWKPDWCKILITLFSFNALTDFHTSRRKLFCDTVSRSFCSFIDLWTSRFSTARSVCWSKLTVTIIELTFKWKKKTRIQSWNFLDSKIKLKRQKC